MNSPAHHRKSHESNSRHAPRLNESFNLGYDQYYGRQDFSNTNQDFSMDQDNNFEPNSNFNSNTNPSTGANYNQQRFDYAPDPVLRAEEMSSHLLGWDGPVKGPHYGKGPKGYKRSDENIKDVVCEVLRAHPEIDASEVEVEVVAGEVKLFGSIVSRQMKRMAEGVVEFLPGVEDVHNALKIMRPDAPLK